MQGQILALSVFTAIFGCGHALADESQWQIRKTDQHTFIASIDRDFKGENGALLGSFSVEASPKRGCGYGVELALLHGNGYGNPLGKISPPNTTPLYLEIDGRVVPIGDTYWIKYDNGYSALASADDDVLAAIRGGKTALTMLTSGTAKFEFPLAGADQALDTIESECRTAIVGSGSR